jgi:hypothetical protein
MTANNGIDIREPIASYKWRGPSACDHVRVCLCDLEVQFRKDLQLQDLFIRRIVGGKMRTTESILSEAKLKIDGTCEIQDGIILKRKLGTTDEDAVRYAIAASGHTNIRFITPLNNKSLTMGNSPVRAIDPRTEQSVRLADMAYFRDFGVREKESWYAENVWRPYLNFCPWQAKRLARFKEKEKEEVPSLLALSMRVISGYNSALGTTNGRPHVISGMDNLEGSKIVSAIAQHARPTDKMTPGLKVVLEQVPEALNMMYTAMGTAEKIGTVDPIVTMDRVKGMYLGASAGSFLEHPKVVRYDEEGQETELIRRASQKKIHSHFATLHAVADFLSGGIPIDVINVQSPKNELYFAMMDKQWDDAAWSKFLDKLRLFEISNEFFIDLERITNLPRALLERGWHISIGMKWSHGGAFKMATRLSYTPGEEWKRRGGDGDFEKLDQNIHRVFLVLFDWMGAAYFKKEHPHYHMMMRAIKFVAMTCAVRLVRVFRRLWAIVVGKMPSGRWMTSHGDSWVVVLWFFLFGLFQIRAAPIEKRAQLEAELLNRIIMIIVYGDDHITTTNRDWTSEYFNEDQFAKWCMVYLGVQLRDTRSDCPFVVQTRWGYRKTDGLVYLRHNVVRNQNDGIDQAYYLPFRNAHDYQVRAVWGRECKDRDIYDFILSLLGHSYGTHGSNFNAYLWLKYAFISSFRALGATYAASLGEVMDRAHTNSDFVKKMRQMDIRMEDLRSGFPTWSALVQKNAYDPIYHSHSREDHNEWCS